MIERLEAYSDVLPFHGVLWGLSTFLWASSGRPREPDCRKRSGRRFRRPATRAPALFQDLGDHARAHGAAAFANGEAKLLLHRDRRDQLDRHVHVVARHDHLGALRQLHHAGHVGRAEVELRAVVGEERRMPAPS